MMGIFGGIKSALIGPSDGGGSVKEPGLVTYLLSGRDGVDRARSAQQRLQLSDLIRAMPIADQPGAPAFSQVDATGAPVQPGLSDPDGGRPYQQRMQAWLRDFAAKGGDVPLSALMPKAPEVARMEGPDGIYENDGTGWKKALAYPTPAEKLPFGWTRDPVTGQPKFEPGGPADPAYVGSLSNVRAAGVAAHRAPPRASSGGRRGGGAINPNAVKWD